MRQTSKVAPVFTVLLGLMTIFFPPEVVSQAPPIQWIRQFGTGGTDRGLSAAVDASGNVYVAGDAGGALPGQTHAGGSDTYVRKYDANGNELWTRQFGISGSDFADGVAVDASGVYVTGFVASALPGQTSTGGFDAFVRKYDANGNELWTRQFGTSGSDFATRIAVDASGIYVTGVVVGALPGQTSAGGDDAFVRKYDASGTELWTRQFGAGSVDVGRAVAVDTSGVYVAGYIERGTLPGQTSAGCCSDAFVRKYDASGNELWTRQFGTSATDFGTVVTAGASGVYVVGTTYGTFLGQINAGGSDPFVRKYDANGNEQWTRQFGTAVDDEEAFDTAVNASGVYVTGGAAGLPGQTHSGGLDAYVRKYDANGNELWTLEFGTSATDFGNGVAVNASGVYVSGGTGGALPGQTSAGGFDAFVVKLAEVTFIPVSIDIKPGSFPNSINLGSQGTVPVAIFSAPAPNLFDATTVDPTSVSLAGASVALKGKGTPMASVQDVNGDGLLDLVVHVSTQALQLSDGDTQAILTGQTFSGQQIQGSDSVRIVP